MKSLGRRKSTLPRPGVERIHSRPSPEELFHGPGESPAVCSITVPLDFNREVACRQVAAALARCVEGIRDWASYQHHLVGHIKVFAESAAQDHLWLASTGNRIHVKSSEGWDTASSGTFLIRFTAIIFGVGQEPLHDLVAQRIQCELNSIRP